MPCPSGCREDTLTGCWLWQGKGTDGYAAGWLHRVLWQAKYGPLPPKVQLDHLCRRRGCVRPAHMDPVSNRTNTSRIHARGRRLIEKCYEGHYLDGDNGIDTPEGGRVCRRCSWT